MRVYIVLVLAAAAGPILWSAFICVPKWYRKKVEPTRVGAVLKRLASDNDPKPKAPPTRWRVAVMEGFVLLVTFPLWGTVGLVALWMDAWRIIITRACPYTEENPSPIHDLWSDIKAFMAVITEPIREEWEEAA